MNQRCQLMRRQAAAPHVAELDCCVIAAQTLAHVYARVIRALIGAAVFGRGHPAGDYSSVQLAYACSFQ